MQTAKTLIRLGGCPGWSESSLGAHAILLVLSWGGSNSEARGWHVWTEFFILFWQKIFLTDPPNYSDWQVCQTMYIQIRLLVEQSDQGLHYLYLSFCFHLLDVLLYDNLSHVLRKAVLAYATHKGTDQPAHPCSLISAFVVCCLDSIIPLVSISKGSAVAQW